MPKTNKKTGFFILLYHIETNTLIINYLFNHNTIHQKSNKTKLMHSKTTDANMYRLFSKSYGKVLLLILNLIISAFASLFLNIESQFRQKVMAPTSFPKRLCYHCQFC